MMPKRLLHLDTTQYIYLAIIVVATIAYAILAIVLKNTVDENHRLANASIELSQEIQDQRRESVLLQCEDQNMRHKNLLTFIDKQPGEPSNTILEFVNVLLPERDCKAVLETLVPVDPGEKNAN